jgi:chemotaxis protein MotA
MAAVRGHLKSVLPTLNGQKGLCVLMDDMMFDSSQKGLRRLEKRAPQRFNSSLLVGIALVCAVVGCGLALSEAPLRFLNIEGLVIVIGGTMASTMIQFSLSDVRAAYQSLFSAFVMEPVSPRDRMTHLLELSRCVKERGLLALEELSETERDEFLRLGLMLAVDGRPVDDMRRILKTEMEISRDRAWRSVQVWETMGNFAPAMGLIGTLLGLIHMLGALNDAATVGPAMSMALVATLYGSVAANVCFFPIAGKLRVIAQERDQCKSITLEGLLSISRLENPMMLEQRLQSFASIARHT